MTFNTAPTLSTNALNGHSVVKFNGSNQNLQVLAGDSPMSGASDFTLAVVFRPYAVGLGADGADWYNRTGLLDSEQGGDINDWGFDWSSLQHVGAGRGGYDVAVYSTAASALASAHVALYSKTGNNTTLLVDGEICRQTAGGSSARNKFMFAIGSGSGNNRFLNGDIAEIQIYRTALLGPSLSNTWQRLAYTYGITNAFAPQAVDLIPDSSVVNVASNAVLDLNDQSETVAGLSGAAGASVTLGAGTLTLGGAASPQTFSGSVSGSGGLVKTGDGSQTLSGTNAYSGATAVSGGTLLLAGGSLAGPVTVGAGASFGTAGTATLSLGSGLTINGTLLADVALNGTSDVLNVTGNLALGAASALQIADTGLLAPVKIKYTLITYTGTRTGKFKSSNLPAGWAVLYDADNKRVQVGPSQGTLVMLM